MPKDKSHKVASIVVPSVGSNPELLQKCVTSLENLIVPSNLKCKILVVLNIDQRSANTIINSLIIVNNLPIEFIIQGYNSGFAKATNDGFFFQDADYYLCVNDDVVVHPNWLQNIIAEQVTSKCDMVGSKVILATGKVDSLGFSFFWRGKAPAISSEGFTSNESDYWLNNHNFNYGALKEPFGVDAAACLYTHKLISATGGFNEDFFAYLEDVDLALRARLKGMSASLANNAIAYHYKHQTSTRMRNFKQKQDFINWLRIAVFSYPFSMQKKYFLTIFLERLRNLSGLIKIALTD